MANHVKMSKERQKFIEEHPDYVKYKEGEIDVICHPRSCFFCVFCTDIFYDDNGPYMFMCNLGGDTTRGLGGFCSCFEKEAEEK